MKMVKSLLLGTAAGLVAVAGAQAADLPVKAKPVQYVKICSLYGAGFYYIPGTDTCIKIGGWVRMQMGYNYNGNMSNGPLASNAANRSTNDFMTRNRGYITADARSQTEYGTLRAYIAVGLSNDNPIPGMASTATTAGNGIVQGLQGGVGFSANRAFIQLGGFTAGLASSFFDFTDNAALAYNGATAWYSAGTTTGDPGWQVLAYTAQLGNGLSATFSIENPHDAAVTQYLAGTPTPAIPSAVSSSTGVGIEGNKIPDFVANLRVDQAWGSAQVMGAIHDASTGYYGATPGTGHPGNVYGYALGAGIKVNLPMLGKGDYLDMQAGYSLGASKYTSAATPLLMTNGAESGKGVAADTIYGGAPGDAELTKQWGFFGGYQHNWNPKWKTSIYGGYVKTEFSSNANALINTAPAVATGADADWSVWHLGTRTAWAPVPNLEVGVDILYSSLQASNLGTDTAAHSLGSNDQSAWTAHLRIQRNFYP